MLHYVLGRQDTCTLLHKCQKQQVIFQKGMINKNILEVHKVEPKLSSIQKNVLHKT